MKSLFFVLFFLLSVTAQAWTPELVKKWDDVSATHKPVLNETTFATFWGGFRRVLYWQNHKGGMMDLPVPGFRKPVPIYLSQRDSKADLYIFYPGVFGKPDGKLTPHMIDMLEKKNGHVIVIPNIVADSYLVARPVTKGDNLARERSNQNLILAEALKKIGHEKIGKIHLIGESLGCFQAANLDFKFDSMTLLWPPLYLDRSIKRFDKLINQKLPDVQNKCSFWWKWPSVTYEIMSHDVPKEMGQADKDCFGAWVIAEGFVSSIQKTSQTYLEEYNKEVPELFTFTSFIKTVLPDFSQPIEDHDQNLSLVHLLSLAQTPKTKIRITSSVDDFLNDPKEWDDIIAAYPELKPNFYLHSWGGHCGPMGVDGFMDNVLANP